MYCLIGHHSDLAEDGWCRRDHCESCGRPADRYLFRKRCSFHVFFIPVLRFTTGHYCRCAACGTETRIKANEYRALHQEALRALSSGSVPADVVIREYTPKALGLWKKRAAALLAGLFALLLASLCMILLRDYGALMGVAVFAGLSLAVSSLLLYRSIKPLVLAHKRIGLYRSLSLAPMLEV